MHTSCAFNRNHSPRTVQDHQKYYTHIAFSTRTHDNNLPSTHGRQLPISSRIAYFLPIPCRGEQTTLPTLCRWRHAPFLAVRSKQQTSRMHTLHVLRIPTIEKDTTETDDQHTIHLCLSRIACSRPIPCHAPNKLTKKHTTNRPEPQGRHKRLSLPGASKCDDWSIVAVGVGSVRLVGNAFVCNERTGCGHWHVTNDDWRLTSNLIFFRIHNNTRRCRLVLVCHHVCFQERATIGNEDSNAIPVASGRLIRDTIWPGTADGRLGCLAGRMSFAVNPCVDVCVASMRFGCDYHLGEAIIPNLIQINGDFPVIAGCVERLNGCVESLKRRALLLGHLHSSKAWICSLPCRQKRLRVKNTCEEKKSRSRHLEQSV
mmetsp:Transcript_18865/g.45423  ORF Transcript_18865/g.45423 Transcript_18865/m.45423 type:complete len:372 (+) Transcript_18865:3194-4309(+)